MTHTPTAKMVADQTPGLFYLRAAGTSIVLDARGTAVPTIVHWGADLGALSAADLTVLANAVVPAVSPSSIDVPLCLTLLPLLADGWSGRPGVSGFRRSPEDTEAAGHQSAELALTLRGVQMPIDNSLVITVADDAASVTIVTELELERHGILRIRHTLTNTDTSVFELGSLDTTLPVPDRAGELLDFTGLWSHERRPQRITPGQGIWSRESRHGRPGHDDPFLTVAGTPGFGFRSGEAWAVHLAWSGDKRVWSERSALGYASLGTGELLAPGELSLASGKSYTTPWTIAVYAPDGLDGLSARLHPWIRSWSSIRGPRPVVLNTWEAVYFDHDLTTLSALVDAAAQVGVERFVLDDGWFTGRSDDKRALGDWYVDPVSWPQGLHPLIERVHAAGLDFGLWVEPEMVSLDSDIARLHPDWVLGPAQALGWRFQRVLDLDNAHAFAWVLGRLTALLEEYPIAYLKWDHNRDLLGGSAHRQTRATYRLIDALREAYPDLEIESCASGGGRIDLGMLSRVHRVWTSDTNDPLERQQIQRYTGILVPPEYLGGHLGAATAHTTGRTASLGFRFATALFGSAGIEWNLTAATAKESVAIAGWIALYKRMRPLLHTGQVVHQDATDPALELHGVVAQDRSAALFAYVALAAPRTAVPAPLRFIGLDPSAQYRVEQLAFSQAGPSDAVAAVRLMQDHPPAWLGSGSAPIVLGGAVLGEVGLPAPLLVPEEAALFFLTRVG